METGLGMCLVVKCLPRMHKALDSIPGMGGGVTKTDKTLKTSTWAYTGQPLPRPQVFINL